MNEKRMSRPAPLPQGEGKALTPSPSPSGRGDKGIVPGEVLERIRARLEGLWNVHYDNPEVTTALVETYEDARLLKATLDYAQSLAESMAAVAVEMRNQRDKVLDELAAGWRPKQEAYREARRDLAKMLANDLHRPVESVEKALGALLGDDEVYLSPYTAEDFYEALGRVVEEVQEELDEQKKRDEEDG